jgi:ribose-phosphate pyrophosphokinase
VKHIAESQIKELVVTDTVPVPDEKRIDKITVLPTASLIGEAIHRIHAGLSVGAMFQ